MAIIFAGKLRRDLERGPDGRIRYKDSKRRERIPRKIHPNAKKRIQKILDLEDWFHDHNIDIRKIQKPVLVDEIQKEAKCSPSTARSYANELLHMAEQDAQRGVPK